MTPPQLRTARLLLTQPNAGDIDACTAFCQDPIFEHYMVTPWPYQRSNAEEFLCEYVPSAWESGHEASWAIRLADHPNAPLLGMIGIRKEEREVGYWLGSPHRGNGYMPEALQAGIDWNRESNFTDHQLLWWCVAGNVASARTAQKCGFVFRGEDSTPRPGRLCGKKSWIADLATETPGLPWPISADGR